MRLQAAKNDFFKSNNDLAQNSSKKPGNSKAITLKKLSDYEQQTSFFKPYLTIVTQPMYGLCFTKNLAISTQCFPGQPPDLFVA
jgi:hypothetical protein